MIIESQHLNASQNFEEMVYMHAWIRPLNIRKLPARSNICYLDSGMSFAQVTEALTTLLTITILKVAPSSWSANDTNCRRVVSLFGKEVDLPSPNRSKF